MSKFFTTFKRAVEASGPGALPGFEVSCTCGDVYRTSLESFADQYQTAHQEWHRQKRVGEGLATNWKAIADHYAFIVPAIKTATEIRPRCPHNMGFMAFYSQDLKWALVVTRSHYLGDKSYAEFVGMTRYDPRASKDGAFAALLAECRPPL